MIRYLRRKLANLFSDEVAELEHESAYWRAIATQEFDKIKLVDLHCGEDGLRMAFKTGIGGLITAWMMQSLKSAGADNYVELEATHPEAGAFIFTVQRRRGRTPAQHAKQLEAQLDALKAEARAINEWNEEDGPVLWWKFPITEPPYVGTPNDIGYPVALCTTATTPEGPEGEMVQTIHVVGWPGYHTHWTKIPGVRDPSLPQEQPQHDQDCDLRP